MTHTEAILQSARRLCFP